MNKKGFTLVELLGVITILALVSVLASYSVSAVRNLLRQNMWKNKINLIENGASLYGEDNKYLLEKAGSCKINDTESHDNCLSDVTVGFLLQRNYIATDERNDADEKIITDSDGVVINDNYVYIWLENEVIYAKYAG